MITCIPLTLVTCLCLTYATVAHSEHIYANNPGDITVLTEQVWIDDTDSEEVLISNHQEEASMPSDQPQLNPTVKRWRLSSLPYQPEVLSAARDTQIEPALIHAVIAVESGYNARAMSDKGAYGLMQVLPATARGLSPVPLKQWSARQQVMLGAHYLKQLLAMFKGDVRLALAAYNAGPQAVKTHHNSIPPFAETRRYVPKVMAYYHAFKQQMATTPVLAY